MIRGVTVYVINPYEIIDSCSERYILNRIMAAKIPSHTLADILIELNQQEKREISEKKLCAIALQYEVNIDELKQILISKLRILAPLLSRKIPLIYINSDDELVEKLLCDTLKMDYNVQCCPNEFLDFQPASLVIYFRRNYSDPDLKQACRTLMDDVYLITCGVLHHQLLIDNIYFNHSGLPTHASNLHDAMSAQAASKNNSLSFYRLLYTSQIETFPMLPLNPCQRGYIAYSIYQFLARFVNFDGQPTPHDAINWRWQVDLLTFGVQKEVAILAEPVDA